MEYWSTTEFGDAYCVSRPTKNQECSDMETVFAGLPMENTTQQPAFDGGRKLPITSSDIQNATVKDSVLRKTGWPKSNQNADLLQFC